MEGAMRWRKTLFTRLERLKKLEKTLHPQSNRIAGMDLASSMLNKSSPLGDFGRQGAVDLNSKKLKLYIIKCSIN